ncbi:hypothetical protein CMU55_13615 [Elizabethkingia anophelis]|nr:hypothetical protein [Elizabethkingia anophelis]
MSELLSVGLTLISVFKESILKKAKEIKDDYLFVYENGLIDYINNFHDKYSSVKTFIYRNERVNFYDIYYPVFLSSKKSAIKKIDKLFDNSSYVTIIGNAGSGKSMLTKHIFLSSVKGCESVPIVVELRNLNSFDGSLKDYIIKIITQNKIFPSDKVTEEILSEGNFVFIMDGYDEIFSQNKEKRSFEIEEFVDNYSKNKFALTSRPYAGAESLQRFDNYRVLPLSDTQIDEFIEQQFLYHENKDLVPKILEVINDVENYDYSRYLSNPLLLSMFIFTFSNYPELPKNKNKFYWNVFDTLCTKHDTFTKTGGWLHERKSNLKNDEFENILKWFSYISLFEGKYNFDYEYLKNILGKIAEVLKITSKIDDIIYDLNISISIIIQDGSDYTFPHKSLQEYFTALFIKSLDSDKKEKIYSYQFRKLNTNSLGGNANFYKLCLELDKVSFQKYYLIPALKSYIEQVGTDPIQRVISIFNIFNLEYGFTKKNDEYSLILIKSSSFPDNLFMLDAQLYDYHAFVDDDFLNFLIKENDKFSQYLEYKQKNKRLSGVKIIKISKKDLNNITPEIIYYLEKSKMVESYNAFFEKIIDHAKKLEESITKEEANTIHLLDFYL